MIPITNIDRHFRIQSLIRDINRSREDLGEIETRIPGNRQSRAAFDKLERAAIFLNKAVEELASVPTLNDLETALSLSIETVKERKRCESIGNETETAQGVANTVSRFPKPLTIQSDQFGD